MNTSAKLSGSLRRSLLLKVISKPAPSREDVASVIELTSGKLIESLGAQSLSLYLVDKDLISFKYVYYSPTLWKEDPSQKEVFDQKRTQLLATRIPLGSGIVGKTIAQNESFFFQKGENDAEMYSLANDIGFEVTSMLSVPLRGTRVIGAIQLINKEGLGAEAKFTRDDLAALEEVAEYSASLIQRMLDPNHRLNPEDTARFISRYTDTPLITRLEEVELDEKLIESVGDAVIRREGILPYRKLSTHGVAALVANPLDYPKRDSFQHATGLSVDEVKVAPATLIETVLKRLFKESATPTPEKSNINIREVAEIIGSEYVDQGRKMSAAELEDEQSAPIIQLANRIIEDAYISGASDIHVEPQEVDLIIRYRIDGICQEMLRLPNKVAPALVARLKIMASLDIAERRLPQDGRIVFKRYTKKNIDVDLRVATSPMNFGEKMVMRILDKQKSALPLPDLGFSVDNLAKYRDVIRQPYGMILHCGPTGSGKSMTLYSALGEINSPELNIQTAEDPIEYTLAGINQLQVNRQIGLNFASALRSYLRQDPDIILVGEIRDRETADIALEAALTGHLLLSTLHTNDAPSTVARLADMGIEPFMISSSLLCICSQRLMRRLCKVCRVPYEPAGREKDLLERAIDWSGQVFRAGEGGCDRCGGTGYKGRVGIHEIMVNSAALTDAINNRAETATVKKIARSDGMKTLHQDSLLKVREGLSSVEEALATVPPDQN